MNRRECPEFEFEGKTYRHNFAKPGYVYLNAHNEWKDVPKGWTRILRELPTMEDMERRAIAERAMEETKPTSLQPGTHKAVVVGCGRLADGLSLVTKLRADGSRVAIALRPLRWGPIPSKQPKRTGSKIEQRFNKHRKTDVNLGSAIPWAGTKCRTGQGDDKRERRKINREVNKIQARYYRQIRKLGNWSTKIIGTF